MTLPFENDTNAVVKKLAKQNIKANHRTALSIMSAILIAATFMCTLCSLVQSYWNQRVQQEIFDSGNWDAQILEVQANQIELIKKNENIKDVMVKGNNQTFLLSFRENDPYLLVQNCDAKYWESMHEKNLIIRGRVPEAPGEIVVGKKFFEDNPSFKIGDTVDLELGERRKDNRIVDFLSPLQDGEVFVKTDNVQYTIVGEIDRTVSSAYNGYPAYGWLNLEETPKDASVVVYTQTKNPRKIYETVPQIAQAIGLEQDEYGEYPYRYHTALLGMYGIYEPGHFWSSDLPKLFLSLLIVAVASMTVFAYIIRGAFSISAKRKIKELGILKSIGMTPKQIRKLVKYEAKKEQVSYLDIKEGQKLQLTEKFLDSVQGNYSFDIQISSVLTEMPDIGLNVAFYTLPIIVPMEEYYDIINNFGEDRAVYNYRTYMNLRTEQGKDVTVQSRADQLCGEYLSKNDFFTSSKTQRAADRDKLTNATMLIVYSLTALFGIVGISSAVAAILNSLYQRKKEFAMLRSVGLDKKGLCHLLYTEGFLLVIKPLLIGISILILVSTILIWLQDITVIEFLKVFPFWGVVVYIILTFAIIRGIYMVASRKIRRDIIVEVLKDETV